MTAILLVALGGALGAVARHGVNTALAGLAHPFPWATLLVNVLGSGIMGALSGYWAARGIAHSPERLILAVGFLGAFTTFSTFAVESAELLRGGQWAWVALHWLSHGGLCVAAALAGLWLTYSPKS